MVLACALPGWSHLRHVVFLPTVAPEQSNAWAGTSKRGPGGEFANVCVCWNSSRTFVSMMHFKWKYYVQPDCCQEFLKP